jgi:hypothetical protein
MICVKRVCLKFTGLVYDVTRFVYAFMYSTASDC